MLQNPHVLLTFDKVHNPLHLPRKTTSEHFWLRNVFRATTACTFSTSEPPKSGANMWCFVHFDLEMRFACTFSTSQLPKVLRERQVFTLLTWKCASRHNGVDFFDVSTSKSAPRPLVFNTFDLKMCFAPQWRARAYFSTLQSPKTLKKQMFRNFSTFPRTCIFFLLTLSLLCMIFLLLLWLLPPLLFHLSRVHIVGSLTSKLPSII